MGRHYAITPAQPTGGEGTPLTFERSPPDIPSVEHTCIVFNKLPGEVGVKVEDPGILNVNYVSVSGKSANIWQGGAIKSDPQFPL